jgi:HAMP domain-containing protein
MLVICEDCAKKYNIDESRIKGKRARFTCNECGHIIIVDKADLSRTLFSSAHSDESASPSSSIDLLREMEAPITNSSDTESMSHQQETEEESSKQLKRKNRGTPIFAYFIVTMIFTLVCISLVTGYLYSEYLYSEYLADVTRQGDDYRDKLLLESSLAFGAVWMFVLLVISLTGRRIHNKFKLLVENANQLSAGDYDISIVKNGPREVRDLAYALERIRQRLQNLS